MQKTIRVRGQANIRVQPDYMVVRMEYRFLDNAYSKAEQNLVPGDFRTVRQRLFYLGNEVDNNKRLASLEQECSNKRSFHRAKLGF